MNTSSIQSSKARTESAQKTQVRGKGKSTGKGKGAKKKSGKTVIVVSSDSEDLEVDFPHHSPNQPLDIPAEEAEETQEPNQPLHIPVEEAEETQEPN